jgi:hypothetical protein
MVMWLAPPSITVLSPRMSGSSEASVIVWPAMEFENVMVVPGLALAKLIASRNEPAPLSLVVVTTKSAMAILPLWRRTYGTRSATENVSARRGCAALFP